MIGDVITALMIGVVSLVASEGLRPDPASAQTWTLTHPQPDYEDHFGRGTAVFDGIVYGGAPGAAASGRVFRWERDGAQWMPSGEVIATDPTTLRNFGTAIDGDGTWLAVAAPPDNNIDDGGAVVMFELVSGGLVQRAVIVPIGDSEGDYFGMVIDLDGETLVVWRWNEPEVYTLVDGVWTFESAIAPSNPIATAVGSLALDGDTLVVGDPFADVDDREDAGRATVFVRENGVWSEQATFTQENPGFDGRYATGVGLDGDVAVAVRGYMGAWIEVWEREGTAWTRASSFQPDVSGSYFFGDRVRLLGDRLVVADGGSLGTSGTSVLFQRTGDAWPAAWVGPDSYAIGFEGDILTLGRPIAGEDEAGEVLVVELSGAALGEPCTVAEDCLGSYCADGVCCNDHCLGDCDVCSVQAGAEQDGVCAPLPTSVCCTDSTQCADEDPCTAESCSEGACVYEDICCASNEECPTEDPCMVGICQANGYCDYVTLEDCEPATTSGSGPVSASGESGEDTDAGADGGSAGSSGCGCSHAPTDRGWALLLVLTLFAPRRRVRA